MFAVPVRRQTALQYSIRSQSRAARRVYSIASPQTRQAFAEMLDFFLPSSMRTDLFDISPLYSYEKIAFFSS
jgi:hypothetical protein